MEAMVQDTQQFKGNSSHDANSKSGLKQSMLSKFVKASKKKFVSKVF